MIASSLVFLLAVAALAPIDAVRVQSLKSSNTNQGTALFDRIAKLRDSRLHDACSDDIKTVGAALKEWLKTETASKISHDNVKTGPDEMLAAICGNNTDLKKCTVLGDTKLLLLSALGQNVLLLTDWDDVMTEFHVFPAMKEDEYGLLNHTIGRGTMLDIGGHIGTTAILAKKLNPDARVISFEPMPRNRFYFEMNLVLNDLACGPTGVEVSPDALSSSEGTMTMVFNDQDTTGTTAYERPWSGALEFDHSVTVKKVVLEKEMEKFNVTGNFDFVKLDCEGCEYDILPALQSGTLARFGYVTGEVHKWVQNHFEAKAVGEATKTMCTRGWKMMLLEC